MSNMDELAQARLARRRTLTVSGLAGDTRYSIWGRSERYRDPNLELEYYRDGAVTFGAGDFTPASFFAFPPSELRYANQIWKCCMRAQHKDKHFLWSDDSNILRPLVRTYSRELNRILLGFEGFDGFLTVADQEDFACSGAVPGNPTAYIQELIRGLLLSLKSLHRKGVSSTMLYHPCAFVWVGNTLKIWLLDICAEDNQLNYREWTFVERRMLGYHIQQLGSVLATHLLAPEWYQHGEFPTQRGFFLDCFSANFGHDTDLKLHMLATHPFLSSDSEALFKELAGIFNALKSRNCRFNVARFATLIAGNEFRDSVIPTGYWIPDGRLDKIDQFLRKDAREGFEFAYDGTSSWDLLRFLRHLYQHYTDIGLSLDAAILVKGACDGCPTNPT